MIDEEYELEGKDAEGRGIFTDKGFLVKAGSLARLEIVPSGKRTITRSKDGSFPKASWKSMVGSYDLRKTICSVHPAEPPLPS